MAIYVFGEPVTVLRYATREDVLKLDPPFNAEAKKAVANKSWVVVRHETGPDSISRLGYLRADGALPEIMDVLDATEKAGV